MHVAGGVAEHDIGGPWKGYQKSCKSAQEERRAGECFEPVLRSLRSTLKVLADTDSDLAQSCQSS